MEVDEDRVGTMGTERMDITRKREEDEVRRR
jgi:hypothetical protein